MLAVRFVLNEIITSLKVGHIINNNELVPKQSVIIFVLQCFADNIPSPLSRHPRVELMLLT